MGLQIILVNFTLSRLILNERALGHGWGETQLLFKICLELHLLHPQHSKCHKRNKQRNETKVKHNKFHHLADNVLSLQCLPPKMLYSLMPYSLARRPLAI